MLKVNHSLKTAERQVAGFQCQFSHQLPVIDASTIWLGSEVPCYRATPFEIFGSRQEINIPPEPTPSVLPLERHKTERQPIRRHLIAARDLFPLWAERGSVDITFELAVDFGDFDAVGQW